MENVKAVGFKRHIPNIITSARLAGSFSLLFLMGFEKDIGSFERVPWIWLIVYIFLSLSDFIDGIIARKLNAKSDLGALLDAISDAVLIVIGAATVFIVFVDLTPLETGILIGLLVFCLINRLSMSFFAKKFFGTANMLHTYGWKVFAWACGIGIGLWAFLGKIPWWSVAVIVGICLYSTIDGIVYCVRAAKYDVNFKGHFLQKYEARKK